MKPSLAVSMLLLVAGANLGLILCSSNELDIELDEISGNQQEWNLSRNGERPLETRSIVKQAQVPDEGSLKIRLRVPERRRVRQDIYNFYNSHQRPQNQRPNYWRPRPRPRPPPTNYDDYDDYDDTSDYYARPPPYRPYYGPRPLTTTTTTTTTTPAPSSNTPGDLLGPIGYMLIDTYHTPAGSYSRPIAFFGS